MSNDVVCSETRLGRYLTAFSPAFHEALVFKQDPFFGLSVFASEAVPSGSTLVSCPLDLALTPTSARRCLRNVLGEATNHELMATYLSLHVIEGPSIPGLILDHQIYVDSLPKIDDFRTSLYFSNEELRLLQGTNLSGATEDRRNDWNKEWMGVVSRLSFDEPSRLTWPIYLWASTVLSSRAFPSSLLDGNSVDPTPILFPGVDTLNHRYGQLISWETDVVLPAALPTGNGLAGKLSLVSVGEVPAGEQVFNSYGAKPNEELLLGYGFTMSSNPADVVALKLSLPPSPTSLPQTLVQVGLTQLRHFVPRSGIIPEELLAQMRLFLAMDDERQTLTENLEEIGDALEDEWKRRKTLDWLSWENEMDMLDALESMLMAKLDVLYKTAPSGVEEDVRPEVLAMVTDLRQGQIEVLSAALEFRQRLSEETIAKAEAAGFMFGEDEEDEEAGDSENEAEE